MKILVLGCNGMAGHLIALYMCEQGHHVIGFAREKSKYVDSICGDAKDTGYVKRVIQEGKFDVVINCIGILNQCAEDQKSEAVFLNSYLPHYLADITAGTAAKIVHISTDCVFSGKSGGYTEQSLRDGESFYDRSKALGELEDDKNITLRTSIVGPDLRESGIGLLNWFMHQNKAVRGYTRAIWTGQTTLQLAKTIVQALKTNARGLYNAVPAQSISKYELLGLMNRYIRKKAIEIEPWDDFVVDKSLVRTRFDGLAQEIPGYDKMLQELGVWMRGHQELYPHYEL